MALEPIAQDVWVAPMPHTVGGLRLGTRMTVVRLSDGSLFVHSPIVLYDALEQQIDSLGPVAHIVAPSWRNDLGALRIGGCALGETVFFHHPSRTLISADFIENFDTSDHWATRMYLKATGIHGKIGLSRVIRIMFRDKAKARRAVDQVIEWNPERITLAHGQPILADAQEAIRDTYSWLTA